MLSTNRRIILMNKRKWYDRSDIIDLLLFWILATVCTLGFTLAGILGPHFNWMMRAVFITAGIAMGIFGFFLEKMRRKEQGG
jgi:hypothetical protein